MTWKKTKKYLFFLLYSLLFIIVFYFSVRTFEGTGSFFNKVSLNSGYGLKIINISGNKIIQHDEIYNLVEHHIDMNTFTIPISQIKKDLEKISWCKSAIVIKKLPDKLIIQVLEYQPFAILNESEIITNDFYSIIQYNKLAHSSFNLLRINSNNIYQARKFIKIIMKTLPIQMFSKIKSVDYISNRRWNIIFANNLLVKLPENNLSTTLQSLIKIYQKHESFNENLNIIDLRLREKVFIINK
jgi:cell division protein FtsQ